MSRILIGLVLSLGAAVSVRAQTFLGTITGRVVDASTASVGSAAVTATNQGTGLVYKTVTNGAGNFTLQQLPVGKYDVTVEAAGFRKMVRKDIELNVAQILSIEAKLEVER
jgi:hypothetical protein